MSNDLPPGFGDTAPTQLFRLLLMLGNHLRTRMDARLAPTGLTTQQAAVLTIVEQPGSPPTLGMVAKSLGSSHQNARQIVAALERKGLVAVAVDPDDRRALRITATPAVGELFDARNDDDHSHVAAWFDTLNEEEQAVAVGLLGRVWRALVDESLPDTAG